MKWQTDERYYVPITQGSIKRAYLAIDSLFPQKLNFVHAAHLGLGLGFKM